MRVDPAGLGPVVIDTNVWISGWLSRLGPPAMVIRQVVQHGKPVFTRPTFAELSERVWLPKFDRYLGMDHRGRLLDDVDAIAHWIEVRPELASRRYRRDADDDKFIHAALAAGARWLVTADRDLLASSDSLIEQGLSVMSPADALRQPVFAKGLPA